MPPGKFITIRKDNKLAERAGAQAHFDDLCALIGVEKLRDPENYSFEHGAKNRLAVIPFDPVQDRAGPISGNAATYCGQQ